MDKELPSSAVTAPSLMPNTQVLVGCAVSHQPCSLWEAYFCKNDQIVLCDDAVAEEVESLFCPRCNSANEEGDEGAVCSKCWTCPCCQAPLAAAPLPHAASTKLALLCGFCFWDSRGVGLVGDSSGELVMEAVAKRVQCRAAAKAAVVGVAHGLQEGVKQHKLVSMANQGRRWGGKQMTLMNLGDSNAPKQVALVEESPAAGAAAKKEVPKVDFRAVALKSKPGGAVLAGDVCSVEQHITQGHLVQKESDLLPLPGERAVRRLKRCPKCDKLLIRPYKDGTTKFRVARSACYSLPSVTLTKPPNPKMLAKHKAVAAEITLLNPRHEAMTITFSTSPEAHVTAQVTYPKVAVVIPGLSKEQNDETPPVPDEAKEFVVRQHKNVITLKLPLVPLVDEGQVVIGLTVGVEYTMVVEGEEPDAKSFSYPLWVQVGKIVPQAQ